MVRPTHASVDLDALVANYHAVERQLSASSVNPTPRIIAVIKANAYGHGATRVGLALERAAGQRDGRHQRSPRPNDASPVNSRVANRQQSRKPLAPSRVNSAIVFEIEYPYKLG